MAEIQAYLMMLRRNLDQEWNQESYPDSLVQGASARNSRWRLRQGKLSPTATCVWSPLVWGPSEESCKDLAKRLGTLCHLVLVRRDHISAIPDSPSVCGPVQAHVHANHIDLPSNRLPEEQSYLPNFTPPSDVPDKDGVNLHFGAQAVEEVLPRCASA